MSFTLNLNGEDSLKMVLLDSKMANINPNYLEDAMPSAKTIHDRINVLINTGKFDSGEANGLLNMYDGIKQFYLMSILSNFYNTV